MDELFVYQNKILEQTPEIWYRSAFGKIDWEQRLWGIKGLRGVGKTTMLLQYIKHHFKTPDQALYVTADNPWFYEHTLFDLIEEWHKYNGKLLVIDEIHKYPNWARELKVGYDGHPDMQFIFSASSAYDIFKAEADLSRRAIVYSLPGLSFREYLEYSQGFSMEVLNLKDLLKNAESLTRTIVQSIKPIPHFKRYLQLGYFPFSVFEKDSLVQQKFAGIVNTVLENDLAYVQDYSPSNIRKIKQLLGVIAQSAPFSPNISKIADKLHVGRVTVYNYLKHLEDAHILNLVSKPNRGISALQKPDKIYFENTNLAYALDTRASVGAGRETFFVNQLKNAGYNVQIGEKGDFLVNDKFTFEIGGNKKSADQIRGIENAYLVLDDREYAFRKSIPLWLFGFLY